MVDVVQTRVNQTLMRPSHRGVNPMYIPNQIMTWADDVTDQVIDLGDAVNAMLAGLLSLISEVQTGTRFNIFKTEITESGVTQVEVLNDSGDPVSFVPGKTMVFVDKRLQTNRNYTETMDASGDYRYITFTEELPYDPEWTPTGPEIWVIYFNKV